MKLRFHSAAFLVLCFLVSGGAVAADHFLVTPQGTRYQDLKPGMGEAAEHGDVVTMHFVGWLDADGRKGKEIYNSRREREPVSFGIGQLHAGLRQDVWKVGMKPGGKRLLMLPPALGYGSKGVEGVIPPDARLIFVIDVMSIEKSPY